ncbi:MAG: metallophosphoesterase [Pseudomonadota bacterium]
MPPPPIQAHRPLYVIGDVHGRADLLVPLVDQIMQDVAGQDLGTVLPEVVFVGDLIDRGPDTKSVIEFLIALQDWPEIEATFLVGNHELMLLQFLHDPIAGRRWLKYGGYETLQSYAPGRFGDLGDEAELRRIATELKEAMGTHLEFVENLRPWHSNGNLLITHAGADPSLAPAQQTIEALVWGVPSFYQQAREDGLWVVHGHTIVQHATAHEGRIAVDTGAYRTGVLSALRVVGTDVRFLSERGTAMSGEDDYTE